MWVYSHLFTLDYTKIHSRGRGRYEGMRGDSTLQTKNIRKKNIKKWKPLRVIVSFWTYIKLNKSNHRYSKKIKLIKITNISRKGALGNFNFCWIIFKPNFIIIFFIIIYSLIWLGYCKYVSFPFSKIVLIKHMQIQFNKL